jgi:hypothetical protein
VIVFEDLSYVVMLRYDVWYVWPGVVLKSIACRLWQELAMCPWCGWRHDVCVSRIAATRGIAATSLFRLNFSVSRHLSLWQLVFAADGSTTQHWLKLCLLCVLRFPAFSPSCRPC